VSVEKVTAEKIRAMKGRQKIASLTAYDFPMAKLLDAVGIPLILVGDSLGMVVLGYPDTTHVTMEEMEHHVRAVARATPRALLAADMPYRSYETSEDAVANARRLVAAGAEAVKAEGGRDVIQQVLAIIAAGIPFLGHLGMLPQSVHEEGGYHIKGKVQSEREALFADAQALVEAGRAGTDHAAGREGTDRAHSHSDDRHRFRAGLRRSNPGDDGFARYLAALHSQAREAKVERRGIDAQRG